MDREDEILNESGELWDILVYSGTWISTTCGPITKFSEPQKEKSLMVGIPYEGNNTGQNPDLRLITFQLSDINGPVTSAGVQSLFLDNYLIHRIEWRVEPIDPNLFDPTNFSIGFYSANYTKRTMDPNAAIPLLSTDGPAFYMGRAKGSFCMTYFNGMYVIVNAKVFVKIRVTYRVPESVEIPCFTKLFKRHKYIVDCEVIATEQLTDDDGTTFLRPANKYVDLSNKMIDYLESKSVILRLFDDPITQLTALSVSEQIYTDVPLDMIPSSVVNNREVEYIFDTSGKPGFSFGGRSFNIDQGTVSNSSTLMVLRIFIPPPIFGDVYLSKFDITYLYFGGPGRPLSIALAPILINEQEYVRSGMEYSVTFRSGIINRSINNISVIITETRNFNPGVILPPSSTLSADVFTIFVPGVPS